MLGLDAAGKTTLLYKLARGREIETTIPTIGFNVETLNLKQSDCTCWDVGGCDKIRPLWRHYLEKTELLVFVIDANDRDRIESAREEFSYFVRDFPLPVLVLSNKQDLPRKMPLEEVIEKLQLRSLPKHIRWEILPICAQGGEGLDQVLPAMERLARAATISSDDNYAEGISANPIPDNTEAPAATNESSAHSISVQPELTRSPDPAYVDHQKRILESTWQEWLHRPLEPLSDKELLEQLTTYELNLWDHYTHVRVAYAWLLFEGWESGRTRVCATLSDFIANSARTNPVSGNAGGGRSFHFTMTMFWTTLIYHWLIRFQQHQNQRTDTAQSSPSDARSDFPAFLAFVADNKESSTDLADKGLFRQYYNAPTIFGETAKKEFVSPDLQLLPSIVV